MPDDERCHICRLVPVKQSKFYRITTCESCEETAKARGPVPFWQAVANWLNGRW